MSEFDNDIECQGTNEIVCPYCGHEFSDSWEFGSDEETHEGVQCGSCERTFTVNISVSVSYSSSREDCKDEKHTYLPARSWNTTQEDIERYKREGSCLAKYITEPKTTWQRACANCEETYSEDVALGAACPQRILDLQSAEAA